jgi:predicted alpha/beta hydrolase family esterase
MTVQAIKAAIEQLTEPERRELADWFEQLEEEAWDAEMEQDFAPGGLGRFLLLHHLRRFFPLAHQPGNLLAPLLDQTWPAARSPRRF